jgi:hypothetical protein
MPLLRMLCYGRSGITGACARNAALLERPLKSRDRIIESLLAIGLFNSPIRGYRSCCRLHDSRGRAVLRRPAYAA